MATKPATGPSKTATNFRELLAKPTEGFKRPPPLPEGHFSGTILGHTFGKSKQKGTAFVEFNFKITAPGDDVDEELMAEIDLSNGKEMRQTFYITPGALWRLSDFLNAVLGEQEGLSFDERIPETRGVDVMVQVSQRADPNDEDNIFNDIKSVMKA